MTRFLKDRKGNTVTVKLGYAPYHGKNITIYTWDDNKKDIIYTTTVYEKDMSSEVYTEVSDIMCEMSDKFTTLVTKNSADCEFDLTQEQFDRLQ